jgi:ABC-type Fe3+ transport system permease subunit
VSSADISSKGRLPCNDEGWRPSDSRDGTWLTLMARGCCVGLALCLALPTVGKGYPVIGELRPEVGAPRGVSDPMGVPGREIDAVWPCGNDRVKGKGPGIEPGV